MKNKTNKKTKRRGLSKFKKKQKIIITISAILGFFLILGGIYLGVAQYFKTHYYSGSIINGVSATGKTVEQMRKRMDEELKKYTLEIKGREKTKEVITGKDINLTYVEDYTLEKLLEQQNPYLWFQGLFQDKQYTMAVKTIYDESLLENLIKESSLFDETKIIDPVDAKVEEKDGTYVITEEILGTTLLEEKVITLVKEAVTKGDLVLDLEEKQCYVAPAILKDNEALISKRDTLNKYASVVVNVTFGSRIEVVDKSVVSQWIVEDEQGNYSLDKDLVVAYVKNLAYKYDTFGLKRKFKTNAGKIIDIPAGGDYGWAMNRDKTTKALLELMEQGGTHDLEPIYKFSAKSREENDIGGTYVEIDLKQQRMWCYKDGKVVVDTPIVTGNASRQWETPVGIYAIDAKKSPSVLTGEGYVTDVTYWMPFNGNVGIHDADTWRQSYGGEIYKTNGSHGCVNTPTVNAKIIYGTVSIGTAVVVY